MPTLPALRLLPLAGLILLTACAQKAPSTLSLDEQPRYCDPLELHEGQEFNLRLPSNPTTGFRWVMRENAAPQLKQLGPEVYTTPEEAGVVGSAGVSTWRFRAVARGEARLELDYRRPWENGVAAAKNFDCRISVK